MEHGVDGQGAEGSLRDRIPAQSVVAELLREQARVPSRGFTARLLGVNPLGRDSQAWFKGAEGEIEVARILAGLGPGYVVCHAVPVGSGDSDIDHVVIGPTGVFAINTKNHSGQKVWVGGGTFMVNGTRLPHIRNSVFEAKRSEKILTQAMGHPVAVTAMIAVVNPSKFTVRTRPNGVEVLTSHKLLDRISSGPRIYDAGQMMDIVDRAQDPRLWHPAPTEQDDRGQMMTQFTVLRQAVRSAQARRRGWARAGMALIATIVIAGALAFPHVVGLVLGS